MELKDKLEEINKQINRYIKITGIYDEDATCCRTVGLTEGWLQMHKDLPKQYCHKEIYNAIARGFYKFMQNERNSMHLSKENRRVLKKNSGLVSIDALRRTKQHHLGVFFQDVYGSIGQKKSLLKRLLGALNANDKKVFKLLYREVITEGAIKPNTYGYVAEKMGVCSKTIQNANKRIRENIAECLKGE